MKPVLYLFHRDLRITDNPALLAACRTGSPVIPCALLPDPHENSHGARFIVESLKDLAEELSRAGGVLYLFDLPAVQAVRHVKEQTGADRLFTEQDEDCRWYGLMEKLSALTSLHPAGLRTLTDPRKLLKADGTPYQVFTPFLNRAKQEDPDPPEGTASCRWYTRSIPQTVPLPDPPPVKGSLRGGRSEGLSILDKLGSLDSYEDIRDIPDMPTSRMSPHLAWGTISVRELYFRARELFSPGAVYINEVYWRDFWYAIAHHVPHVFQGSYHRKYDHILWDENPGALERWKSGVTGFPLVDAGMRELDATGFMHNRVRMITASFLTKDLHINWQEGESWFASRLTDFDRCVNNGNWQWAASTGCDAQPFFRIFNPWSQQRRYDPDARYIKRWIPELRSADPADIHRHEQDHIPGYPSPMVNHKVERLTALERYRSAGMKG